MNQEVINTRIEILKALGQKSMSELTKGSDLQKNIMEQTGASQAAYETALLVLEIDKWATCVLSDVFRDRLWSISDLGRAKLKEVLNMEEVDTLKAQQDNHPSTH